MKKYHVYHSHDVTNITSIFTDGARKSEETTETATNSSEIPEKKIVEVCMFRNYYTNSYRCIKIVSL